MIPKTFLGRLLLVVIASVAVSQLFRYELFGPERDGPLPFANLVNPWVQSLVDATKALEVVPVQSRNAVLTALLEGDPFIKAHYPADWFDDPDEEQGQLVRSIAWRLHSHDVAARSLAPRAAAISQRAAGAPQLQKLEIAVRLTDRSTVRFVIDDPAMAPPRVTPFAMWVPARLVLLVLLLGIGITISVHQLTRPLSRLVLAADALGKDFRQAPITEEGPVEVRRLAKAFNGLRERLVSYLDGRTRMLAAMSHDFRTPLTRLHLRAESIEDEDRRVSFQRDLDEMQALVESTLDLLRGPGSGEPERRVDLKQLLAELQAEFAELGHAIQVTVSDDPLVTKGYPLAMKRCLRNIVENAVKFGRIAIISATHDDSRLYVEVSDEGPGIPERELRTVFKPFYRIDGSRNRDTGGVGLGLAIALEIAQRHGGDITLSNRPQGGLRCVLEVPIE